MTAELGVFFLILALLAALFQAAFLLPLPRLRPLVASCLGHASLSQLLAILLAFATLMTLRLDSDFSVVNVVAHSNLSLPLLYKITGTWGNHEGSMLLWVLVLAGFGALLSSRGSLRAQLAVAVQAGVCAGVLLFILFTSNPFERRFPPTVDGQTLNPLLQDIALSIHPPLLYVGYVGFSIVFSLAVAALVEGKMGRDWAVGAHPWILAAWSALTLGIGLGSWWAYRELGWGGWWFWDPVENASLLPWLAGTALLHANIVLKKRGLLASWVLILAIITFALSLLGTFLVRSGALTSVHSFASDPARGLFILGYIVAVVGGALLLFALRAGKLQSSEGMLPVSREGMIVINNMFLLSACATVLLGTTYPLLAEWLQGERLSVGPPYFNATCLPLLAIPLLFAGLTPLMQWKTASLRATLARAHPALMATLAAVVLVWTTVKTDAVFAAAGFGLSAWLAASSLQWLLAGDVRRGNVLAVFLGHAGVAVMVCGITSVSLWKETREQWLAVGEGIDIGGYRLDYGGQTALRGDNYDASRGIFTVYRGGREVAALAPEYRRYDISNTATSEADILSAPLGDLYTVVGETSADGKRTSTRVYYVPMIGFIWLGFMLMAVSGIVAILQQRGYRRGNITV